MPKIARGVLSDVVRGVLVGLAAFAGELVLTSVVFGSHREPNLFVLRSCIRSAILVLASMSALQACQSVHGNVASVVAFWLSVFVSNITSEFNDLRQEGWAVIVFMVTTLALPAGYHLVIQLFLCLRTRKGRAVAQPSDSPEMLSRAPRNYWPRRAFAIVLVGAPWPLVVMGKLPIQLPVGCPYPVVHISFSSLYDPQTVFLAHYCVVLLLLVAMTRRSVTSLSPRYFQWLMGPLVLLLALDVTYLLAAWHHGVWGWHRSQEPVISVLSIGILLVEIGLCQLLRRRWREETHIAFVALACVWVLYYAFPYFGPV